LTEAENMSFISVARFSELHEGQGICVEWRGQSIALFRQDNRCYALENRCPHRDVPIHDGEICGLEVRCPLHGARFSLITGKHQNPPAESDLRVYEVQVIEDEVQIEVEE
jgi:3-phenylpropionate/trans-cinnamate dioxygenase ferredoxin subunit